MRFRTTIDNVPTFLRIAQAIGKLQKKYIITFAETQVRIVCNSESNEGGIQVWSVIKVDALFSSYRIQSNTNNEITLSLSTDALISVLRSSCSSSLVTGSGIDAGGEARGNMGGDTEEVTMKLAKKDDQPVLAFEIVGWTRVGRRVRVSHDVRVDLMRGVDVDRLIEPMCPEPDVHILLPPLSKLHTIVERLKLMSNILAIRANNNKHLELSIRTESVNCETLWTTCTNPSMKREREQNPSQESSNTDEEEKDPDKMFTVFVPIRAFLKFLNSHIVSSNTIACICHKHCLILYVYIGALADAGGVLTYYIPTIIDDEVL